jgi:hypothetical protein
MALTNMDRYRRATQQETRWTRVKRLLGGRMKMENHR